MRGDIFKHWQISAAILFSIVLVTGAYLLAHNVIAPQVAQASTETALLQAIATKDTSGDGLPDWQKSLYGIPINATTTDYFNIGMTDGEAVAKGLIVPKAITDIPTTTSTDGSTIVDPSLVPAPADGTLTAQFAQNFFMLFVAAKEANSGADLSESQMNDVANQSMNMLTSTIKSAPDYKSITELTVKGSGEDAMKAFAASAETILLSNPTTATTTDINYFKSAVMDGNASAYEYIVSIAKVYRSSAAGIAALPVPQELAQADLLLVNVLMRLSQIDTDFTKTDSDPLVAILALQQYQTVTSALQKAFMDIGTLYATANITLPSGAPGALFVNMIADIKQKAAAGKP